MFCCLVVRNFILFSLKSSKFKNQKRQLTSVIFSHEKVSTLKFNTLLFLRQVSVFHCLFKVKQKFSLFVVRTHHDLGANYFF